MMGRRFVLLDRDGTVVVERHYLSRPDQLELLPGAARGLRALQRAGFGLVLVTNQSGVARGYFDRAQLSRVHDELRRILGRKGVRVDGIYACIHHPDDGCNCRKPAPGLAQQAAHEHDFALSEAYFIGDKPCDVDAGRRAGATSILVRTGYGDQWATTSNADHVVADLVEAATLITKRRAPRPRSLTDAAHS